jgi:hypothetical protein
MEETEDHRVADATDEAEADDSGADTSASVIAARFERLLRILLWVGDADVARALRSLPVSEFDSQPLAVRTALRTLRRKRDPATALQQPQYRPTAPLVAEALSEPCTDAVVTALGDAADAPDRPQVLAAIEEIQDRFPSSMIALMLAYISVTDMAAADVCDEILTSDERFTPRP